MEKSERDHELPEMWARDSNAIPMSLLRRTILQPTPPTRKPLVPADWSRTFTETGNSRGSFRTQKELIRVLN
jgi:hypothetical protein